MMNGRTTMDERRRSGRTMAPAGKKAGGPRPSSIVRLAAVLLVGALAVLPARGQGAAGAFARLGFGARGIGAGNALVADRAASPYYNPAFAPLTERQNLAASAALLSFDRELQFLQFAAPLKPHAGVVFGLTHAGVSGIDGRDDSGYHTETFSTDEYQLFAAFGLRFSERFSGGLAAKFYRADYDLAGVDPVEAVGFDLGFSAQLTERLAVGFAASDLLARYEWDTSARYEDQQGRLTSDRLPTRLRLGAAYRLAGGAVQLLAEYESRFSWREVRVVATQAPEDGSERETTEGETQTRHDAEARLGAAYQPVEILTLRAGLDRLTEETGPRPSAGFSVSQDIGRLPVQASYATAYEGGPGTLMHLFALRLFL